MISNLVDFFIIWNKDIKSISVNQYNDIIELLINEHYILCIDKNGTII